MIGDACSAGQGGCKRDGTIACQGNTGVPPACNVVAGLPSSEICDGIDNNCNCANVDTNGDGVICGPGDDNVDEGLGLRQPCVVGIGACARQGLTICGADFDLTCSAVPGDPAPETCDGLDNDCDGILDEGFGVGGPCDGSGNGSQCMGVVECDGAGETRCSTSPTGSKFEAVEVTCNDGVDNDCDGTPDNGVEESAAQVNCGDLVDNDCDGLMDAADPDCP